MRRRRKVGVYAVAVVVVVSSLAWYVTTLEPPLPPYSITEDDAHGVESIYPGDKSYGVQKHVLYPTKKPSHTTTHTDVFTDKPATVGLVLKLTNNIVDVTHTSENVEKVGRKAADLPQKQAQASAIVDRPRSAASRRVYVVQKTKQEERGTHESVSAQSADPIHQRAVLPLANMTSSVRKTNLIEYPTRPPRSRIKQFNKHITRAREGVSRTSKQSNTEREMEVNRTAQVYEKINLNADNSIKFAKIVLPIKRRSNASATAKKLDRYPTRSSQSRIKQINQRTTQTQEDLSRSLKQSNTEREVEVKRTAQVNKKINPNTDNFRTSANISLPIKRQSNASEMSKKLDGYPTRPPQSRIKQFNQHTTKTQKYLPRTSKQPTTEREVGVKRTALVYEKINFNADNSNKFANILLPVRRQSNASETLKKLVEYPTKIPRKDVDAMFRRQAREEADNRVRKSEAREESATTTLRAPASFPGVRATRQRIRLVTGGIGPAIDSENVVSMSVYGSAQRYMAGVMRNAELVRENFPGWKLRVYTEVPSDRPRYGVVPQTVIERLRALGTDIYFMDPREETIPPMMWRFLVADDMSVDRFIIRDADSRLTERDAAAVRVWVASGKPFNCIRDHPSHAQYAVSGGMWGGKPAPLRYILRKSWRELMRGSGNAYLQDMNFLIQVIWPKVEAHAYCSDSVSCEDWPNAHPFPVPRYGYDTVGQVVNENEMGRVGDIQILRRAGENRKCSPKIGDLT